MDRKKHMRNVAKLGAKARAGEYVGFSGQFHISVGEEFNAKVRKLASKRGIPIAQLFRDLIEEAKA